MSSNSSASDLVGSQWQEDYFPAPPPSSPSSSSPASGASGASDDDGNKLLWVIFIASVALLAVLILMLTWLASSRARRIEWLQREKQRLEYDRALAVKFSSRVASSAESLSAPVSSVAEESVVSHHTAKVTEWVDTSEATDSVGRGADPPPHPQQNGDRAQELAPAAVAQDEMPHVGPQIVVVPRLQLQRVAREQLCVLPLGAPAVHV